MAECLICANPIEPFHNFGRMPIANGFLQPEQTTDEFFFELRVGYCDACHMVQLTELVEPDKLFHSDYAYFSSISTRMANHFRDYAEWVRKRYANGQSIQSTGSNRLDRFRRANRGHNEDPFVVEVGSNDGIMLRHFAAAGIRHVGIEPSANVAKVASELGVNTLCDFFNEETARKIHSEYGPADVVQGANVICHIPDLHSIFSGLDVLLKWSGVFVFEEPYLGDIVAKTSYDQIYDEHVFYFSLHSVSAIARRHGMEVIDAIPQPVHGGSMRYVVARKGSYQPTEAVATLLEQEVNEGLAEAETFAKLSDRINTSRDNLVGLLNELKAQGNRIAGYGATSKSTTVTNFCGIGPDLVEYISDTTPGKQGKLSPGVHIPVVPYQQFADNRPDIALLFAWNHAAEIFAKEDTFRAAGGRFVTYVPEVKILEDETEYRNAG